MRILLKFYATWCNPCKTLEPMLNIALKKCRREYELVEIDVDLEENQEIMEKYKIISVPTLVILEDGKFLDKTVKVMKFEDVLDFLN